MSVSLVFGLLLWCGSTVLAQEPDPTAVQSCNLFKRTVFEEKIPFSFFFPNAPIEYETVDSCVGSRPLIVDGTPAGAKEFPHAARLGIRDVKTNATHWFCGGTLISNRLVVTAAHCFFSSRGAVNVVRLGELDFETDTDDAEPEDFGVLSIIPHPEFDPTSTVLYNDIGLIRLDRAVNLSVYKHPACLPFDDGEKHDKFIAIGWGHKKFAGKPSQKLLKVTLNGYGGRCSTAIEANEEYPRGYEPSTQLCIGSEDLKNTCNGDSGGPVLAYHEKHPCMHHVMGITSSGSGCESPGVPGIYTRIHYYMGWIKQELAKIK